MIKLKKSSPPAILLLAVFILLAVSGLLSRNAQSVNEVFFTNMILQVMIFILPALFYCLIRRRPVLHKSYTFTVVPLHPLFLVSVFAVMVLGSTLINLGVAAITDSTREFGSSASSTLTGITNVVGALHVIFSLCIVPAIAEEFFFRGVLLSEYTEQNPNAAVILTTIVFAASHFDLTLLPSYLFSGFLLAFALRVTRSLLAPILIHCAVNLFNIFLLPYLWQVTLAPLGPLFTVFIVAGLLLSFALVAFREAEHIYTEYASDPKREGDTFGEKGSFSTTLTGGLLSPPYMAAVALSVLMIWLS
ncbi:MAG: CPBP family intramembrane metalloprotease [Clostridia bacterium]|nr:CPBP family intramembrane metalloprotease [Clostridia bacterium]